MPATMKDFKTKFVGGFTPRFADFREKYGPKILSITMHIIFVLMLLWSNNASKQDSEIPRYIEIRIGSPFNSGYTSAEVSEDSDVLEQQEVPYKIWKNSPTETQMAQVQTLRQMTKDYETQQAQSEPVQPQQVPQPQKPQKKVLPLQQKQKAQQGFGEVRGNSNKGQESATYLEWLQLTVQEMSQIPIQAREQNISGRAVLRLTFNRAGYVSNYWLVRATGSKLLDAAALRVARRLVTEPFPPMPTEFEQGKQWVTYDFPISFRP